MKRSIALYLRLSKAEMAGSVSGSIARQRLFLWDWMNGEGLNTGGVPEYTDDSRDAGGVPKYMDDSRPAGGVSEYTDDSRAADGVLEFVDDGYSGMTENRPGYEKLLAGVLTGKIGMVLVKDFSRLSRDHLVLAELREYMFPLYGVRLVAPGDSYDSLYTSEEGLGYSFRSLFYEYYCHDISRKVKKALQAKKENGEYATGAVPFGYESINGIWQIQPEEADILRFLFGEVAAGKSYREAGECVGMEAARVWYLLHNPVYLGHQVWHRYENHIGRKKKTSAVCREDWCIRRKAHEAIIDEDVFWQIQHRGNAIQRDGAAENEGAVQQDGITQRDRRAGGSRHIFSGITKCRDCGRALVRGRRKRGLLCCRHCTGREAERISIRELLEICRLKVVEQYGKEILGEDIVKVLISCEKGLMVGDEKKVYEADVSTEQKNTYIDTDTVRAILQGFFRRIEVAGNGDVWIGWNFTESVCSLQKYTEMSILGQTREDNRERREGY
ncbi:MAG: recombinase family protein [Lachnospiraceae bacterium]|nr:recombinase family protein [Lachnospiraceae bacterium]